MLSIKHRTLLVLPDVNYGNSLENSYCTVLKCTKLLLYAIHFKSTKLHTTVRKLLIERDWIGFTVKLLLVV